MSENARNVAVGLTVIGAMVLMGAMIVIFAGVPQAFQRGYEVKMLFDSTHDAHEGDAVHLRGMRVGRITRISFTQGDPAKGVTLAAHIRRDVNLPGNTRAYIYTKGVAGGAYIELKPEGELRTDPSTHLPLKFLPKDRSFMIHGTHRGTQLLPEDLKQDLQAALRDFGELKEVAKSALTNFGELSANLNDLLAPTADVEPTATQPEGAEKPLRGTLTKLDRALEAVAAVLGDAENQANLKLSLANLAEATAKSTEAMEALRNFAEEAKEAVHGISKPATDAAKHFDEVAKKLIDGAEKISETLTTINKAARKMESGKGTAAQFINDPKLYENFTEAMRQLNELIKELRGFVETWKKSGLPIKLK